jgi:hypothetical protein
MRTDAPARPCPRCGSTDAVEIAYGYPSVEMAEAEERGAIVLGGCLVGPESPDYECRDCGAVLPWVGSPVHEIPWADGDSVDQDTLGL